MSTAAGHGVLTGLDFSCGLLVVVSLGQLPAPRGHGDVTQFLTPVVNVVAGDHSPSLITLTLGQPLPPLGLSFPIGDSGGGGTLQLTGGGCLLCWVDKDSETESASRLNSKEDPDRLVMSATGPTVDSRGTTAILGPLTL